MATGYGDFLADQFLDIFQQRYLLGVAERESHTFTARPTRTPDPMYISLGYVRKLIVNDVRQMIHVDSTGGDIRSDQHTGRMILEIRQGTLAGGLALVAMDRLRPYLRFRQDTGHLVRPVFRTGKDQYGFQFRVLQQAFQQVDLLGLLDEINGLVDRVHGR